MFGKFKNIEEFLDSYITQHALENMEYLQTLSPEDQLAVLRSAQAADIAEVKATIKERLPDDLSLPKHYQMIIILNEILQFSTDIKDDIYQCRKANLPVFVAIRYGDRMGLTQPITSGMNKSDIMHFKGQWITRDKAYTHGGAKMSVLHFTHHPVGFTCTAQKCYS